MFMKSREVFKWIFMKWMFLVGIRKDVADPINKESMNKSICKNVYPRF